ncbi:unnamed protein product [Linum trigynum]|uniref:Uncharacterized protein n=1 Tax=Linum trigynum TaxID=586398 RepID=A0AAV2F488_9ROSI
MDIPSLLSGLGWSALTEDQRFLHCPEAVCLFYVNLGQGRGAEPKSFTTLVYDHEITITPDLLASVLSLPHRGYQAGFDGEFADLGFDFGSALNELTRDIGRVFPTMLAAGRLPDDLKVLHFFLTRCLLHRDISSTDILHTSDLWIMSNARSRSPISYASLVFPHMISFGNGGYSGPLPFGPLITRYLYRLSIDLRDKVVVCNIHDDLRPNHVLNRLNADVGRRQLLSGSGGDTSCLVFSA